MYKQHNIKFVIEVEGVRLKLFFIVVASFLKSEHILCPFVYKFASKKKQWKGEICIHMTKCIIYG